MIFLSCWSLAFCVAGIGAGSLASWDEAYYAIVSRGIFRSGDWVHLTYFNGPFYDKPPLYFWTTAAFYHLFGVNEFATRLTSGLAGVGVILTTYLLGKRLLDHKSALAGAGILLSSTDFLHYARWGTLDVTHLFFFTLAIYCYFKSRDHQAAWLGFWLASAAAVLTKGPLIALAAPVILFDCAARWDFSFLKKGHFWAGIPLFALIVLPWHLAAYFANPELFMRDIVYKHYIARTSGAVEGHLGGWYYYIRTLINKYHPWIILAVPALPWAFWRALKGADCAAFRILLVWTAGILAFFTFAVQTKLQWYILPLYPALSLILGAFLAQVLFRRLSEVWLKSLLTLTLLLHVPFSHVLIQDYVPAIKTLAPSVKASAPESSTVVLYDHHEQPAATFYFDRAVQYADNLAELDRALGQAGPFFLIAAKVTASDRSADFDARGLKVVSRTDRFKTDLVFLARE